MADIAQLQPREIWKNFYSLTRIPRPSYHEEKVIHFLKEFADDLGLENEVDKTGNIIIRKSAAPGREKAATLVLQAHVDMVPQKNNRKKHDFTTDPITPVIDGDWVRADETTLGADNGMGVAAAMAVLASNDIAHGPVEVLLTVNEEAGMDGAFGLKPDALKGRILLNLDSEDEGELFIGCAGGVDANVSWTYESEIREGRYFQIGLKGLRGGHSGIDIHLKRANANKVMARLLLILHRETGAGLCSYSGGDMRNAIPREASCIVLVATDQASKLKNIFSDYENEVSSNFSEADPEITFEIHEIESRIPVMDSDAQMGLLNALNTCPDGVVQMSKSVPGVVQTSTNLAIVTVGNGVAEAKLLLRSADDAEKDALASQMKGLFELSGAAVSFTGAYPGWKPDAGSSLLAKAREIYNNLFSKDPVIKVIHAGLECGIIGGIYPEMEMLSFGPTIRFPHSPDEKVHVESVSKFWVYLKALLEQVI